MLFKHKAQNEIMLARDTIHTLMTICLLYSGTNITPRISELVSFFEYVIKRLKQAVLEDLNQIELFNGEEYFKMNLSIKELKDWDKRKLID